MGGISQGPRKVQPVFLQSGDPTKERRDPDSYSPGQIGQQFDAPDSGNNNAPAEWQIVKTDSVMTVHPYDGAVAWWIDRANYIVTTDVTAAGRGNVAGVFRDTDAPQDNTTHNIGLSKICCIQKEGKSVQVNYVDAPVAAPSTAGFFVIPSATAAKADCLAAAQAATYPSLGKAIGAVGAVAAHYGAVELKVTDGTM